MKRAALLCPGRGSYDRATLGCLPRDHPWVRKADEVRADLGLEPLSELDAAKRFEPSRHLRPANASAAIFVKTLLDAEEAARAHRLVCVGGNSLGWYSALAVAGALEFEPAFELVQRMALLQEDGAPGGQVIYPRVDGDWRPDPAATEAVEAAFAAAPGDVFASIELGGYRVLAGTPAGVAHLLSALPRIQQGRATYPLRLAGHGPYHTRLASSVSEAALEAFASLPFRAPRTTLIDGFGRRHTPWSADARELAAYTLGAQVTETFDFTATVRVALREYAPDHVVLPGPGNTLGGVVGQVLVAEGWRGVRSRADFVAAQEGEDPPVLSMGR